MNARSPDGAESGSTKRPDRVSVNPLPEFDRQLPEKLLRVTAPIEHADGSQGWMVAGAIFEKRHEGWKLKRCAPILSWWYRIPIENIERFLKGPGAKKGWTYEWLEIPNTNISSSPSMTGAGGLSGVALTRHLKANRRRL